MSSEMRELVALWRKKAHEAELEAASYIEQGDQAESRGWEEECAVFSRCADELEALLARTEAGADGAANALLDYVPFPNDENFNFPLGMILSSHPAFSTGRSVGQTGAETLRVARDLVALTHPQDASGDAVAELVAALRECVDDMKLTEEYYGNHDGAQDAIRRAEAALAAMQAKEAK